MPQFDTVIKGGTVVTAADVTRCDVGIRDGRIAALGEDLGGAAQVIDATDRLVMPGGIDSHTHIDEPEFMGVRSADDFESATRAAAHGGTTTVLSFVTPQPGEALRPAVDAYHGRAEGKAVIDYGFHLILTDPDEQTLGQDLPALVADGYTSLKVYMTYDGYQLNDRQILDVLGAARRTGAFVMVHAENHHCIHWLRDRFLEVGDTAIGNHGRIAPSPVEREATHRAITLSEIAETPLLLVHMAAGEAVDQLEWGRSRGLRVFGETCPQYLFLSQADLDRPGVEGVKYLCSPPPRSEAEQERLWRALAAGTFAVFSSDHCSYVFDGPGGKLHAGPNPAFHEVPPGVPGIEARLPLLFSEGVGKGRIDLNQFVALAATNAAKLYGMYPRKGTLAVGADADVAIWDQNREVAISSETLHDRTGYTPYQGMRVHGWPEIVLSRGQPVVGGDLAPEPGRGRFLRRERSSAAA